MMAATQMQLKWSFIFVALLRVFAHETKGEGCVFGERRELSGERGIYTDVVVSGWSGWTVIASREDAVLFTSSADDWKSENGGLGLAVGDVDGSEVVAVAGSSGIELYSENTSSISVTSTACEAPLEFFDADNDGDMDLASVLEGGDLVYYENPGWTMSPILASGVVALAVTSDKLIFANATSLFSLSIPLLQPDTSVEVLANGFFSIISLAVADDLTILIGTQLDDSIWTLDLSTFELSRIGETAHGIVDVAAARLNGADLDALAACRDDQTLRRYGSSTAIIESRLLGLAAVTLADLDGDATLDAIAVASTGIFWFPNPDCPIAANDDPSPSDSSKKKGKSSLPITIIVVFVVVAALALLAVYSFFRTEYAADITKSIHNSIRRIRSRSVLGTPSSSQHQIDDHPDLHSPSEEKRIQGEIEAARARALGLEQSVDNFSTELLTLRVEDPQEEEPYKYHHKS